MDTLNLSQIGRRAGVGHVAVSNWRRTHDDFPPAVGGTTESPEFLTTAATQWLQDHGKLAGTTLPPPSAGQETHSRETQ